MRDKLQHYYELAILPELAVFRGIMRDKLQRFYELAILPQFAVPCHSSRQPIQESLVATTN
jgi:hypothetical protein